LRVPGSASPVAAQAVDEYLDHGGLPVVRRRGVREYENLHPLSLTE
jgi:hypothetical protein